MPLQLVALLAIRLASPVQAGHRWITVARTPIVTVEVDAATVTSTAGVLLLWERLRVPKHRLRKSGKISDRAIARVELRCTGATIRTITVLSYNTAALLEIDNFDDAKFAPIALNSTDEALYRYICPRYSRGPR